jgi:L-iditol 2-dehydrogenase
MNPRNSDEYPHFFGGFAEYLYLMPGTVMWKIPDDISSEVAVLMDPLGVAIRGIESAITCPDPLEEAFCHDSSVVVQGSGAIGILTALVARMSGVDSIIMSGGPESRLILAKELQVVDHTIDINELAKQQRIDEVKELTDGKGADVVFECAGGPDAFSEGLEMLRFAGTLVEVGNLVNPGAYATIDVTRDVCGKNARIKGSGSMSLHTWGKAFSIMNRKKELLSRLVTHKFEIEELDKALEAMEKETCMKAILKSRSNS